MTLNEAESAVSSIEARLQPDGPGFVVAHTFERNGRKLVLGMTPRLKRRCERMRVWRSRAFLQAFKNAAHGFDPHQSRRRGGKDGIFLLDRDYRPKNEMMRKVYDAYLDRPDSGVETVARQLGVRPGDLLGARLVAHHGRLLGVLCVRQDADWLILVDWDAS